MREIKNDKSIINIFDDISELVKFVKDTPRKSGRNNSSEDGDSEFSKTESLEEALDLLKYGDEKLYKQISKTRKELNIEKMLGNNINRQKYEKRTYGVIPNVPAYLTGNPLNMINPEKNEKSHRIINILLNVCYPWHVKTSDVIKSGTVYLNALDLLEKMGYRVNLYCGVATEYYDNNTKFLYMFSKIKTDKEPLNLKKICFPIAHPSMLRRIYFKWAESCNSSFDGTRNGYGYYDKLNHIKEYIKDIFKEDYIVLDFASNDGKVTMEDIIKKLKDEGIEIK